MATKKERLLNAKALEKRFGFKDLERLVAKKEDPENTVTLKFPDGSEFGELLTNFPSNELIAKVMLVHG